MGWGEFINFYSCMNKHNSGQAAGDNSVWNERSDNGDSGQFFREAQKEKEERYQQKLQDNGLA